MATVVPLNIVMLPNHFVPDMSKLDPFNGQIGVDYTLTETTALENSHRDFDKDNKTCRGMLLHYKTSSLYHIYGKYKGAKEIWDGLQAKYETDDFGTKKYFIHEYENLCAEIIAEGMNICETFQKDLTLLELVSHIKIEEQNRMQTKGKIIEHSSSNANLVETKKNFNNKGGRHFTKGPNQIHRTSKATNSRDCLDGFSPHGKRKVSKVQAHLTEAEDIIVVVVSEANLVVNITEWILYTGATRYICSSREMFKVNEAASEEECVFMGNSSTVKLFGKGKVLLKLTSGKSLDLNNVLHVPDIRRNFIFENFVGNGFYNGGFFVLDIMMNDNASTCAYIAESVSIWYDRLGYVNVASVKKT
ncbi:hypothetical protein RND81_08G020500 [Saponaria officinalis]|uniref:Retrovirus-related Pol polyprotein from transposon TNT 1-94-like beta-barrel domain-containing protein n=1 Tax=Saponaria officinalis TaxID=3572 RepID=A0AAW1J1U1_SAPOF